VAFGMEQFHLTVRGACKVRALNRSSYRYTPRTDYNSELRQELINLAWQKRHSSYQRLQVLLERRGVLRARNVCAGCVAPKA